MSTYIFSVGHVLVFIQEIQGFRFEKCISVPRSSWVYEHCLSKQDKGGKLFLNFSRKTPFMLAVAFVPSTFTGSIRNGGALTEEGGTEWTGLQSSDWIWEMSQLKKAKLVCP